LKAKTRFNWLGYGPVAGSLKHTHEKIKNHKGEEIYSPALRLSVYQGVLRSTVLLIAQRILETT